MSAETARVIAGALAERLGVEPEQIEATLAQDPLTAMLALSILPTTKADDSHPATLVRFVASILGACGLCLGENPHCAECGGEGAPGSRAPNETALVAWISPPLRRLGLCVGRPRYAADYNTRGGYG